MTTMIYILTGLAVVGLVAAAVWWSRWCERETRDYVAELSRKVQLIRERGRAMRGGGA